MFPANNAWNQDISGKPKHARSESYIRSISAGGNRFLHPDFGGNGEYGIPYRVVTPDQGRPPLHFDDYGDESDPGPYPIPLDAPVERGSDRHVLVVQQSSCQLFELFNARRRDNGWIASSGAKFDLRSNSLRPRGWTSADAAGLPVLPGLARFDEIGQGSIEHALRVTVSRSQNGYISPARHHASGSGNRNLPPMGLRLRLKRSYDLTQFHGHSKVILEALKKYGLIVADNGSSWFITGAADRRWNDDDLNQLKRVPGSAFEAIQSGRIQR